MIIINNYNNWSRRCVIFNCFTSIKSDKTNLKTYNLESFVIATAKQSSIFSENISEQFSV